MLDMWCRGLQYLDLIHFAEIYEVQDIPTVEEYESFCKVETQKMDEYFRTAYEANPEVIGPLDNIF